MVKIEDDHNIKPRTLLVPNPIIPTYSSPSLIPMKSIYCPLILILVSLNIFQSSTMSIHEFLVLSISLNEPIFPVVGMSLENSESESIASILFEDYSN